MKLLALLPRPTHWGHLSKYTKLAQAITERLCLYHFTDKAYVLLHKTVYLKQNEGLILVLEWKKCIAR